MSLLSINKCLVDFNEYFQLHINSVSIAPGQHTGVLGSNGSGKSALGAMIAGVGERLSGSMTVTDALAWVSVEQQQAIIEAEREKDCADILDVIPCPSSAEQILLEGLELDNEELRGLQDLLVKFDLQDKLCRPFRALSTGETKKLLLLRAVLAKPKLLILDEPWDGLDKSASETLTAMLVDYSQQITLVLILNRLSEVPAYVKQILLMEQGYLNWQTQIQGNLYEQLTDLQQLQNLRQRDLNLPEADSDLQSPPRLDPKAPLVKLTKGKISYGEQIVFSDLNWTVWPNQHWQISGPNGSGKTCLLNLITGDHPQCYVNDLNVFGFKRGSGESIWQIKQYIGYLSNTLHLEYRINCSLIEVVLSGFYDSIGLYEQPTLNQRQLAKQWLSVMSLDEHATSPFKQLSFGDQRMALIARAMVKHPVLLILDEPCNGLDELNRLKVLALIDLLAREGNTTLLYVNHHKEDIVPSISQHLCMEDFGCG